MSDWYETVRGQFIKDTPPEWFQELAIAGIATPAKFALDTGKFFVSDLPVLLESTMYRRPEELRLLAPELFTIAGAGIVGGAPGAPKPSPGTFDLGLIRGPKAQVNFVRRVMKEEMKARGKPVRLPTKKWFRAKERLDEAERNLKAMLNIPEWKLSDFSTAEKLTAVERKKKELWAKLLSREDYAEQTEKALLDNIVRGAWFHGRRTYPRLGESFARAKIRTGNLGEPHGISLTADPQLLERHFAHRSPAMKIVRDRLLIMNTIAGEIRDYKIFGGPPPPMRGTEMSDWLYRTFMTKSPKELIRIQEGIRGRLDSIAYAQPSFARVLPRLSGPPVEKILPAWKSPYTVYAQKLLKDAYVEALKEQSHLFKTSTGKMPMVSELPPGLLSILDSPELRMSYRMIVSNKAYDPTRIELALGSAARPFFRELKKYPALRDELRRKRQVLSNDWRSRVVYDVLNKSIADKLSRRGFRGLLYHPRRGGYREYELRMFDPADVLMLGKVKPTFPVMKRFTPTNLKKKLNEWDDTLTGAEASLRDIYRDIDLEELTLDRLP